MAALFKRTASLKSTLVIQSRMKDPGVLYGDILREMEELDEIVTRIESSLKTLSA